MKSLLLTFLIAPILIGCQDTHPIKAKIAQSPKTFCNPVNLNYRFMKIDGGEGIREAADPVVVSFKDKYYLFASKSSGYWYSEDFTDWKHVFITDSVLPKMCIRDRNKHGAPGFCTQSGDALFKLYRSTGDASYAELLRDVIHAHAEGIQPNGKIKARLTYCDADSRGSVSYTPLLTMRRN